MLRKLRPRREVVVPFVAMLVSFVAVTVALGDSVDVFFLVLYGVVVYVGLSLRPTRRNERQKRFDTEVS